MKPTHHVCLVPENQAHLCQHLVRRFGAWVSEFIHCRGHHDQHGQLHPELVLERVSEAEKHVRIGTRKIWSLLYLQMNNVPNEA